MIYLINLNCYSIIKAKSKIMNYCINFLNIMIIINIIFDHLIKYHEYYYAITMEFIHNTRYYVQN